MEITYKRSGIGTTAAAGCLYFDDKFVGFIVENLEKMIAAGKYKLTIQKELTPLTQTHLNNKNYSGWFKRHIEVIGVTGRSGLYFHIGNYGKDSKGCQLPNTTLNELNNDIIGSGSTIATKYFYSVVMPILEAGKEEVWYNIKDNV
ncbi:MAG: DUF5675 family protein [Lutibacter sp.]|jgi:hypothetical protein